MSSKIIPVIMSGGAGTRLWPASREKLPKQFMPLLGPRSIFQETALRVARDDLFERPIIVSGAGYRHHVVTQLAEIGVSADVVLEPTRRDSGPAVAVATVLGLQRAPDALLLILASDHAIERVDRFHQACRDAIAVAQEGLIVTFGIVPTEPSTDYGYLKPGDRLKGDAQRLDAFAEKPDLATAERYIAQGYLWNSGNFLFKADVMREELERYAPEMLSAARAAVDGGQGDHEALMLASEAFAAAPKISIDYAVMEKTRRSAVLGVEMGWSDLGNWNSVWASLKHDDDGNALSGPCDVLNVKDSIVLSDGSLLATVVGLDNVVVVISDGAVLVARRDVKGELKTLLDKLKAAGRPEAH
jgi:mannose-1-phosphate guanylyltransferase/mannose-6-phosphate isomerase